MRTACIHNLNSDCLLLTYRYEQVKGNDKENDRIFETLRLIEVYVALKYILWC